MGNAYIGGNVYILPGGASGIACTIFGDSITQDNYDQSATTITGEPRWFTIANALLGQRLNLINNAGSAGDTTTQMLARINSTNLGVGFGQIGSEGVPPALPPGPLVGSPKIIFVMGGFNDIFGGGATATSVIANLQLIYSQLLATGALVIAMTVTCPNSSTSNYSTATVAVLLAVNDYIRATTRVTAGMILVDAFAAIVDPTNAQVQGLPGVYRDGAIHPNNVGGWLIAQKVVTALSSVIPPTDLLPASNAATFALSSSITQIITNPLLTGSTAATGTGISGNGPSPALTYTTSGSATAVISVASRVDGYGQNVVAAITSSASGDALQIVWPDIHADAVVGGLYVATCEFNVTGPSAAALVAADNLAGIQLAIQYNNGVSNYFAYDWSYSAAFDKPFNGGNFTAQLRTRPLTIPSSGTPTTFRPFVNSFYQGAGGAVISIGRMGLYRVS